MKYANEGEWTGAAIAFLNPRGIRSSLEKGDVIYADLFNVLPFSNFYHIIELNGTAIREILEYSAANFSNVMQVAGLKVTFDRARRAYNRITDFQVICQSCLVPQYAPIIDSNYYKIILPDFAALGGDGLNLIPKYSRNIKITSSKDIDELENFVRKTSPINLPPMSGRIIIK